MSIEKVRTYFRGLDMERRVLEFDVSSATVELAGVALSVPGKRIAKTLSFKLGDGCILIVAAGDAKIDNAKYKAEFHTKAKMLSFDEVEPLTGSLPGGVCPFAVPGHVPVYLDVSLRRFATVFPACGSDNSAIELSCDELFSLAHAQKWIDVCKDWEAGDDPKPDETPHPDEAADLSDGVVSLRLTQAVPADAHTGFVPAYKFTIVRCGDGAAVGTIDLRVGYVRGTYFGGNVGYEVEEAHRGHGYAAQAVKLLFPLARRHGMPYMLITCAPENAASRATILHCGGALVDAPVLPSYCSMYREGRRGPVEIYRIEL